MSLGVQPEVVIGHSLRKFAALHIAGVLSAGDAIFLVGQRAQLLEQHCEPGSHQMLAVRASVFQIEQSVDGRPYEVACINGPKETVLSGTREEIRNMAEHLAAEGFKCTALDVAFAGHSAQLDPILDECEQIAAKGVIVHPPNLPIISPLLGKAIFDDKTVNFHVALETAQRISTVDDTNAWVEIGLHPVCLGFIRSTLPSTALTVPSLRRGEESWTTITQSLIFLHCAGVEVHWNGFHRPFEGALRLLDLPNYSWNDKNYWIQYNGDWALTNGNTFIALNNRNPPLWKDCHPVRELQQFRRSWRKALTDKQLEWSCNPI